MALVFIPAQLRRVTGGQDRVAVGGATLGEVIDAIDARFPGFREHVLEGGELAASLAASVDGDMATAGLREAVGPESEVHFVPALGGG